MTKVFIKALPTVKIPWIRPLTILGLGAGLLCWLALASTLLLPGHTPQSAAMQNSLAALMPVPQTLALHGSLIAQTNKASVQSITYVLAQGAARTPVDLDVNALVINYRDANQRLTKLTWQWEFLESHDQDTLLEAGELVRITVPLVDSLVHPLLPNTAFVLDLLPPTGTILTLKGQTPPQLETSTELTLR